MVDNVSLSHDPSSGPEQAPDEKPRKEYEPPLILSREPLEAMAVTCTPPLGKAPGICGTGRS